MTPILLSGECAQSKGGAISPRNSINRHHAWLTCTALQLQSGRRQGPEAQLARAAAQQAEQADMMGRLQKQLDNSQKALNQQKNTAQRLQRVKDTSLRQEFGGISLLLQSVASASLHWRHECKRDAKDETALCL